MRKVVLLSLVAWLGLGVAVAFADVTITAIIHKDKDIRVTEKLTTNTNVTLNGSVDIGVDSVAKSDVLVNQTHDPFNAVSSIRGEKTDTIDNALNDNALAPLVFNQAAGNMNNQGSAISMALGIDTPGVAGYVNAQAAVEQRNAGGFVPTPPEQQPAAHLNDASTSTAQIGGSLELPSPSINNNVGIVHANQAPGNANSQANVLSLGLSLPEGALDPEQGPARVAGVALAEADLGQMNSGNAVFGGTPEPMTGVNKTATIIGSVNNNTGIIGINQGAGNLGNQANVVSAAITLAPQLVLP